MKKLWLLKAVAGIFVTYGFIGFFGVPYVLKNSVPQKVFDVTKGGILSIESASFNPFTFYLQLQGTAFKTPQKGDFVRIDYLAINLNPLDYLWKFAWVIEDIRIEKPCITVHKGPDGEMNFGWLNTLGGDENASKEESKPLVLLLNNFTLKEGEIDFTDVSEGKHFHQEVHSLGFHLENIDLREASSKEGMMRLYATINEGGFVEVRGKIKDLKPFTVEGSVAFNSGKLHTLWRYFEDKLPIEVADGIASFGLNYALNTDDINATKLSGVHVELNGLRIIPKGQKNKLLDVGMLKLSDATVWPMRKVLEANAVKLDGLTLNASRSYAGMIDWVDYLEQINKAFPEDENEMKIPWKVAIKEVALENMRVHFTDALPSRSVQMDMDEWQLKLRGVSSDPKAPMDIEGTGKINQKATMKFHAQLKREALMSKGEFELNHFSLPLIDPYLESSTNAALRRGDLTLKGEYSYTPKKTSVQGKIGLTDWVVEDRRDNSVLLGWNRIGVTPFVYAYPDNRLKINQISVNGLYTNALINHNKTLNYLTLSKGVKRETNATKEKSNPFGIDVVKLAIANSSATFSDLSLPLPFKTYIHDFNGEVLGISTTKDVTTFVRLKGGVDQYGLAKIDGSLNTNAPKNFTDMQVVFDNLELKQYTPYSLQFLGYKIANGKLFLDFGYKINNGTLDGKNQVVIKQIELGEEKAGGSPWPMRLVVALLEDGEGIIDIDLPIVGDVNSPDFKYGKVVWQVIGNVLTKAVTSPFKLLGSLMGISSEDETASSVTFDAGEFELSPPMKERLDKLASVLVKRPKLSLKVHGGWALKEDDRALRIQKLIHAVMGADPKAKVDSTDAMSLEMLEKTAKKSMDSAEVKTIRSELEVKYPQEAEFVRHYTSALIERLIALQVIAPPELGVLANARSKAVVDYLAKNTALASRLAVAASEKAVADAKENIPSRLEIAVQ